MLVEADIVKAPLLEDLLRESKELTAIFTATVRSVKKRN